jgi:hypothetical protein
MIVMQEQVMSPAKQDAIRDVRLAVVTLPLVDVVSFAPGRGSIAAGEETSAIPYSHARSLALGEEALDASDVDTLAVVVELDRYRTRVAEVALDGLE